MKLFLDRIKQLIYASLFTVICVLAFVLPFWGLYLINEKLPDIIIILFCGLMILYFAGKFIYWLFVEPFKR